MGMLKVLIFTVSSSYAYKQLNPVKLSNEEKSYRLILSLVNCRQ